MKILCPTDMSDSAINGIEYAARLAQSLKSSLTLVNFQKIPVGEGLTLFALGERKSVKEARKSDAVLDETCSDIHKTYNIPCDHLVIPSLGSMEKTIAEEGEKFDLIVLGTNGANELFQHYFGTHSFQIAKQTNTPVLIVPEGATFKPYREIVFSSDYNEGDTLHLKELKALAESFKARIKIIHVSEKDTEAGKALFKTFCNSIEEELDTISQVDCQQIINKDVFDALEKLIEKSESDLVTVSYQKHSILYKLFHKNLIKELTASVSVPMLVLHN